MKTNKTSRSPIERELKALFKEVYDSDELAEKAVRDSIKAYSFVRQEVLYRNQTSNSHA